MARARSVALTTALLVALGATAACGGSSGAKASGTNGAVAGAATTPSPSPTPSPSAPATTLSTSDLKARLLTLADLPSGFTADTDTADTNGKISSPQPTCQPLVDLMNTAGKPPNSVALADASFTKSELGPTIATGLASFPTPDTAQNLLSTVTKAMQACTKLTETDKDGTSYDFEVAPLPFPPSGDASSATRMSADIGGYPAQVDIVLARIGSTLLYVANTGLGDTDSDLTQTVVTRAVAKVRG